MQYLKSSAECFLLSHGERIEAFEAAAGMKGRTKLIGALSTGEAIDYARHAKALDYDSIAATPPIYYGFTRWSAS